MFGNKPLYPDCSGGMISQLLERLYFFVTIAEESWNLLSYANYVPSNNSKRISKKLSISLLFKTENNVIFWTLFPEKRKTL